MRYRRTAFSGARDCLGPLREGDAICRGRAHNPLPAMSTYSRPPPYVARPCSQLRRGLSMRRRSAGLHVATGHRPHPRWGHHSESDDAMCRRRAFSGAWGCLVRPRTGHATHRYRPQNTLPGTFLSSIELRSLSARGRRTTLGTATALLTRACTAGRPGNAFHCSMSQRM